MAVVLKRCFLAIIASAFLGVDGNPMAPDWACDAAIINGYVNAAQDTTTQQLTGVGGSRRQVSVSKLSTATAASNGSCSYALGHLADGAIA